ncbi:MAG: hypothetical protein A2Y24_08530 [Clostridiales bacterium GWE2_32_10]|nr:MAG: hypothetical protein A2Y24_08530 [Clostridiales bacterium GWE2_32_10]HBY20615.1 flagellar hook capping protein [Clostridiales bacterium]
MSDITSSIDSKYLYSGDSAKTNTNSDLDKDAFLNLLVTQLQYQDPLNPTDDKQFIAQMAQFSSLEQMQNLNSNSSKMLAYSLMNKVVQAEVSDEATGDTETVTGTVDGITTEEGKTYLHVDGKDVSVDDITTITDISQAQILQEMETINTSITALKEEVIKLKASEGSIATETIE